MNELREQRKRQEIMMTIEARWRQDRKKHRRFKQQVFGDLAEAFARRIEGQVISKKAARCAKRLFGLVTGKSHTSDERHQLQDAQRTGIHDLPTELVQDIWLRSENECLPFASRALAQRLGNWRLIRTFCDKARLSWMHRRKLARCLGR